MNSFIKVQVGDTRIVTSNAALARHVLEESAGLPANDSDGFSALLQSAYTPRIGETWCGQGGVYAGLVRGENGQPDYHLVVSAADVGQASEIEWGSAGETEAGAQHEWDGLANTEALINSEHQHPAAEWAAALDIEGLTDWYLPARRELALCYANVPELFEKRWYWSSTQCSPYYAWTQTFDDGNQDRVHKNFALRARAVRRFIID